MLQTKEADAKVAEFFDIACTKVLEVHNLTIHKSRSDFTRLLVMALASCRSVQYHALADELEGDTLTSSKVRRISNYMNEFDLDYDVVAAILLMLLPKKGKIWLCIDRTEWAFGDCTYNMLTVTANSHGVGVPIWFEVVNDNGGCSDSDDKLYMLLRCIELLGKERIRGIIGDSEFIGEEWITFLVTENIPFFFDIRCNQYFEHQGRKHQVSQYMGLRTRRAVIRNIRMYNTTLSIGILRQKQPQKGKRKAFLAIITNQVNATDILGVYKLRWSIEVFFQSIKQRGFNIEGTHIAKPLIFRKMFALVCMAFTLCFVVGLKVNEVCPIKVLKHGYKAQSFFRTGLDFMRGIFRKKARIPHLDDIINTLTDYFMTIVLRYKPHSIPNILVK